MVVKRTVPETAALPTVDAAAVVVSAVSVEEDDKIITLPINKKPRMEFRPAEFKIDPDNVLAGASDLRNRLAAFLPSLKAADEQLEKDKLAGRIVSQRIEIDSDDEEDDDEDTSGGDDDSDFDSELEGAEGAQSSPPPPQFNNITEVLISNLLSQDKTPVAGQDAGQQDENLAPKKSKRKNKNKQPYIEMNLGLGVLEELRPAENDEDNKELNERRDLVGRILELRRLQEARDESGGSDSDEKEELVMPKEVAKKVVIEELE
ncbi:hypothetical protein H072_7053 [Dactylellina haptotyla CBS 200.50]|uniref:Uncharacterized protein n=1 Tax=Dactylellina haptotyla (strain CBS 200.50) TaxID=1284197 RepID=S8ADL1_DACHA|nr:hypothetical protein H072_7053 [Dactylellina haptotyla CBS 200.50]